MDLTFMRADALERLFDLRLRGGDTSFSSGMGTKCWTVTQSERENKNGNREKCLRRKEREKKPSRQDLHWERMFAVGF
jgi:hypothetical protein